MPRVVDGMSYGNRTYGGNLAKFHLGALDRARDGVYRCVANNLYVYQAWPKCHNTEGPFCGVGALPLTHVHGSVYN